MLTLPDLKEKQILFLQTEYDEKPSLKLQNSNIVFTKNKEIINQISLAKVLAVFVQGDLSITTKLIKEFKDNGISLFLLKYNFETYAYINSKADGNYLLRQSQYHKSEETELKVAQNLVISKATNQLRLLKETCKINNYVEFKNKVILEIQNTANSQDLLGVEGRVASHFYQHYFDKMDWYRRAPRSKEDIINLLMDIGYTYLFNFVDSLLNLFGFDTYKGVYHKLFFQRKSLSCDIMEPFRCIIDKQIYKSYSLKQIDEKDFECKNGEYSLPWKNSKKYTKLFLQAIMDNKEDIYLYIQQYYRHTVNPNKYNFPDFKIK